MATCINLSLSCLPPFYTIPILPLLLFSLHITFYALRSILPEAIYSTCCVYVMLSDVSVHQLSLLTWVSYRHFYREIVQGFLLFTNL